MSTSTEREIATLEEDLRRTEARQVLRNGPQRAAYAEFLRARLAELRDAEAVELGLRQAEAEAERQDALTAEVLREAVNIHNQAVEAEKRKREEWG